MKGLIRVPDELFKEQARRKARIIQKVKHDRDSVEKESEINGV